MDLDYAMDGASGVAIVRAQEIFVGTKCGLTADLDSLPADVYEAFVALTKAHNEWEQEQRDRDRERG